MTNNYGITLEDDGNKNKKFMKGKLAKWLFLVTGCAIMAVAVAILSRNHVEEVEGWTDFKEGALKQYTFVSDVHYGGAIPPDFEITYVLKKEINMEDVYSVFTYTQNYLQSKKVIKDLQNSHIKKFGGGGFLGLDINLFYIDTFGYLLHSTFSTQDAFNTWYHNNYSEYVISVLVQDDNSIEPLMITHNGSLIRDYRPNEDQN